MTRHVEATITKKSITLNGRIDSSIINIFELSMIRSEVVPHYYTKAQTYVLRANGISGDLRVYSVALA